MFIIFVFGLYAKMRPLWADGRGSRKHRVPALKNPSAASARTLSLSARQLKYAKWPFFLSSLKCAVHSNLRGNCPKPTKKKKKQRWFNGDKEGINYANNTKDFTTWKPNFPIISRLSLNISTPPIIKSDCSFADHQMALSLTALPTTAARQTKCESVFAGAFRWWLHSHTSNYASRSPEIRFNYTVIARDGH